MFVFVVVGGTCGIDRGEALAAKESGLLAG
jgi:hypothetical protein